MENILKDERKIYKLTKSPTDQQNKHINKIITANNT